MLANLYREHHIPAARIVPLWKVMAFFFIAVAAMGFVLVVAARAGNPEDFMGYGRVVDANTQWVIKAYVYNADQTVKIKEFTAGTNHVEKKFASKDECQLFLAKDADLNTALDNLRKFVKEKVDPEFVVITTCLPEAAGTERVD